MDSILSRHDDYSDGDDPYSPMSPQQPTSKRHQKASNTFALMTQNFMISREPAFISLLNQIQSRLTELHEGKDEEYRRQIALLEDARDRELLEVEAARGFALERIEREYEEEKRLAEREYQLGKKKGKDELLSTLNNRLSRLHSDNLLLNQANDATTLTHHALSAHLPLTVPSNPAISTTRNLRAAGTKRTVRNRDDDERQPPKPIKRGRKEDYEIYGEAGMWDKDKVMKIFGSNDDLGTADLATIRKVMGITRTGNKNTVKKR